MAAQRGRLGSDVSQTKASAELPCTRKASRTQQRASHDPSSKTAVHAVSTCSYKHPHVTKKSLPHVTSPRGSLQRRPWAPRPGGRCLPTLRAPAPNFVFLGGNASWPLGEKGQE